MPWGMVIRRSHLCCCRSKAKLVWVLSFVLAPYTHILSQATYKTDAHRFIESVMPRLLELSHCQQAAAMPQSSGVVDLPASDFSTGLDMESTHPLKLKNVSTPC